MTGDARQIVKVKNYSKTGGNCHTKYKIISASSPTPPVVLVYDPNSLPADNKHSNTNIKRKSAGDDYDGHYFKAEFQNYNDGRTNTAADRHICVPFGKTRRIADKYTSGSYFVNGWQINRNLNGINWDVVAHYHSPDANGEYVEVIHHHYGKFKNKDGTAVTNKIQFKRNGMYKVCAFKFPTIHDPMEDAPQRICLDVIQPAEPVYHCYIGIITNPNNITAHSPNITIKPDSTQAPLYPDQSNVSYITAYRKSKEQAISEACTYGENRNYVSGNVWTTYKYLYSNN
ncbi:MAG: hypothetical protein OXF85_02100 [Candidatus Saccharibacteria bacterium]|nr:hypothetical protein [Candidatus Saccharibacteria bacterium]